MSLPNTSFGIAMGLGGNAIMWKNLADAPFAERVMGKDGNWILWIAGIVVWCLLFVGLILKALYNPRFFYREWAHPVRAYFCFAVHLSVVMLCVATPSSLAVNELRPLLTILWTICFVIQVTFALAMYQRWMFDAADGDVGHASPPYLLSTVGWLLLCVLAQTIDLENRWNYDLPSMLFGIGAIFYSLAFIGIMQSMHQRQHTQGEPVLFLIVAPPAVMTIALANFDGGNFGGTCVGIFGFCVFMLLLLVRLGPRLIEKPATLGAYWAYVFPISSVATSSIVYADTYGTHVAHTVAWILVFLSTLALITVFIRTNFQNYLAIRGVDYWTDPLLAVKEEEEDDEAKHGEDDDQEKSRRRDHPELKHTEP